MGHVDAVEEFFYFIQVKVIAEDFDLAPPIKACHFNSVYQFASEVVLVIADRKIGIHVIVVGDGQVG